LKGDPIKLFKRKRERETRLIDFRRSKNKEKKKTYSLIIFERLIRK